MLAASQIAQPTPCKFVAFVINLFASDYYVDRDAKKEKHPDRDRLLETQALDRIMENRYDRCKAIGNTR